jgi:HSP20 family molecular chaperone IbpA
MNTSEFDWLRQFNSVSKHIRDFMEVLEVPNAPAAPKASAQPIVLSPRADLYLTSEGLMIEVELPGTSRDQIALTYEENRIQIRGTITPSRTGARKTILAERASGSFIRTIELPRDLGIELSQISASYVQGILTVTIPFQASSSTSIPIN